MHGNLDVESTSAALEMFAKSGESDPYMIIKQTIRAIGKMLVRPYLNELDRERTAKMRKECYAVMRLTQKDVDNIRRLEKSSG